MSKKTVYISYKG